MDKKRLLSLLLAAGLCVSLTACGGSDSGGGGDFIDSGKQADKYFPVGHHPIKTEGEK